VLMSVQPRDALARYALVARLLSSQPRALAT
jgi:hypothetical protein